MSSFMDEEIARHVAEAKQQAAREMKARCALVVGLAATDVGWGELGRAALRFATAAIRDLPDGAP